MDDGRIGASIRLLRYRRGWRQVDLAAHAGLSQSAVSDMERGHLDRYTIAAVRGVLRALDARAELDVVWRSRGDLARLLDADHARLVEVWARRHLAAGWEVWPEASYSVYGERGRIDLLCFHPPSGVLEVGEIKTGIWNVNETIGALDAKVRLAPRMAIQRGWKVERTVACLVVLDGRTQRRRLDDHGAQFRALTVRGAAAQSFVRDPASVEGSGVLALISLPPTNQGGLSLAGRRGVRRRRGASPAEPSVVGT